MATCNLQTAVKHLTWASLQLFFSQTVHAKDFNIFIFVLFFGMTTSPLLPPPHLLLSVAVFCNCSCVMWGTKSLGAHDSKYQLLFFGQVKCQKFSLALREAHRQLETGPNSQSSSRTTLDHVGHHPSPTLFDLDLENTILLNKPEPKWILELFTKLFGAFIEWNMLIEISHPGAKIPKPL